MSIDNTTELRKRIPGGKYAMARAISERARQLQNGAMPLVEVRIPNPITVAIDEVLQDKVKFDFKSAEQIEVENKKIAAAEAAAEAATEKAAAKAAALVAAEAATEAAAEETGGTEAA